MKTNRIYIIKKLKINGNYISVTNEKEQICNKCESNNLDKDFHCLNCGGNRA